VVEAILHIGPMKTGTTSMAQYFARAANGGALPEGVLYPHAELWFNKYRHVMELQELFVDEDGVFVGWSNPEVDLALTGVATATRNTGGESGQAFFIAETLFNRRPTSAYIQGLRRHFDAVHCIVNVRKQDSAVSSMIAHRMRAGTAPEAGPTLQSHLKATVGLLEKYDYQKNLAVWGRDNPDVTFSVLPVFENDADPYRLVKSVYRACGWGEPVRVDGFEGKAFNPSPTVEVLDQLAVKRRASRRWGWLPQLGRNLQRDIQTLKQQASKPRLLRRTATSSTLWSLSDAERLFTLNWFAESNQLLLNEHQDDTLFASDWSEWQKRLKEAHEVLLNEAL
jgi:hypothetical protein